MIYFKNLFLSTIRIMITKLPFIPLKRRDKQINVLHINKLQLIKIDMKNETKSFIVYLAYGIFLVAIIYFGISDSSELFEWEYLKETSVGFFIVGLIIYLLSYFKLGVKKSSGLNFSGLITTGIYKHIRHPQILSWMLILVGISFYLNSPISSILTLLFWFFFKILFQSIEERQLVKKYGNEYIEYRRKTMSGI